MGFQIEDGVLKEYTEEPGVTEVVIPTGVTTIGKRAFCTCGSLTNVTIPVGVTTIDSWAFSGCSSLTSVIIPDSVTTIGEYAFNCCKSLRSVLIPDSVSAIGVYAFNNCENLTNVVIPDSVTTISWGSFAGCSSLTSVAIPDSVTTIEACAFNYCKSLAGIVIPDSVTAIGRSAFSDCTSLTSVVIPSGVTIIWSGTFSDCTSLTSIVIPDSVIPIGAYAFSGCRSLTSISIPDSVVSICNHAFYGCSNLTSISIPSSAISIGESVFDGCGKLTTILAKAKLSQKTFGKTEFYAPIVTIDPAMLPLSMRHLAAIGYAENPEEFEPGRKKAHLKYLKSNAAKLVKEALAHPALLQLILGNKLLKPEMADVFLKAANEQQNAEAVAMLLDYQATKLTAKEKEKAAQKAETREEKVTDFIFSAEALQELQGKVFVVTGKLTTFISRDEFKACLEACGATLSETLNKQTAYLITNTPNSGSAKNKKAESLGVKKLTEAEFNAMIGRK